MRDKEKKKESDARYREKHRLKIRERNRIYKSQPHIKARNRGKRKGYLKEYYRKNREKFLERNRLWAQTNKEKTREYKRRHEEKLKLKLKRLNAKAKVERIVAEFLGFCKDRYDHDTVRQYTINMQRFLVYVREHTTDCREYDARYYEESKKPVEERDASWTKEYQKLRYVEDLDRDFITRYVGFVNHDEISKHTGLLLNQSEKESRLYPLKAFLKFCERKGYLKKDLRRFVYVPAREKKVLKRVMTAEEMEKFLEAPDVNTDIGIRDRALLEMSYSGLRADEMLTLKLEHVDVVVNSISIYNGKGDKDRVVPMTNEAVYWVKRWLSRRPLYIGKGEDPGYIFITKGRKSIYRRVFSFMVKRYAKKTGIDLDISPHDLRRATATHLAENGASIRHIQALLGHASLGVTTRYLRLTDEKSKTEHKKSHPSNRRELHYGKV